MASTQERLDEFKKLSFEDQKARLLQMLDWLKAADDLFVQLDDVVQNNPKVDAEFLSWTYADILAFADAISESDKQKAQGALTSLQEKIKRLHEIEDAERVKENPEWMLDSSLSQI